MTGSYKPYLGTNTLKRSSTYKTEVKNLQLMLKALGYEPGEADGKYGSRTFDAVWSYQENTEWLDVDGECGLNTKTAIWEELTSLPSGCERLPGW